MLASADADLTRVVDNGVVQPGFTVGGIASFTDPSEPAETYLLGDADNNGTVDTNDVVIIQRYIAKQSVPNREIVKRNGDVDRDGELVILDATNIQRKLARMSVPYPIDQYVPVQ